MDAYNFILKLRAALLMDEPFFGTIALRLQLVEKPEIGTAGVDGVHFFYNSEWMNKLTKHEGVGLVAHEVLHCVLLHPTRRGERDHQIWNKACDYAINIMLKDAGFILPEGGCIDEKYRGMSAESIYNEIYDDEMANGPSPCEWGMVLDAPAADGTGKASPAEAKALEAEWQVAVAQAAEHAKGRGTLPGDLAEAIKDLLEPAVDWRDVLWPFFTSIAADEYSWRKPHRGYISEDEYLPSLYNEACPVIVFVQDSSGSVSTPQINQCWSEVVDAHESCRPEKLVVMSCDTRVHTDLVTEFESDDDLSKHEFKVGGRGGTEVIPAFEYINETYPDCEAVIYLTDLEIPDSDFGEEPHYPVLFVCTEKRGTAPWGEVIFMAPEAIDHDRAA